MIILGLCSCACSNDNDEPKQPVDPPQDTTKTVKIATWNVHNLFDPICDAEACGGSNYEPVVTESYYRTKLTDVTSGIWTLDADVVLLQEIEKEACLNDVQASLGATVYPGKIFGETGRTSSVDVGILTRGEITDVKMHREANPIEQADGSTKLLSRELIQAEITLPNGAELTAFTTHFVSKATDSIGDRRLREAILAQRIIAEYVASHPNRLVVFGGDLNDTPDSEQIQAIGKDGILISATKDMDPAEYTTWHDEVSFDHLFYPAAFESMHGPTETVCNQNRYSGFMSSDHCALKTLFTLK